MTTNTNLKDTTHMDTIHLTTSHTSENGNTYFTNVRFTNRLAISYNIGAGYVNKYLNGITIYAWDGEHAKVITQKDFKGFNYCVFTEKDAKREAVKMLKDYLLKQAVENQTPLDAESASQLSSQLVEEAFE